MAMRDWLDLISDTVGKTTEGWRVILTAVPGIHWAACCLFLCCPMFLQHPATKPPPASFNSSSFSKLHIWSEGNSTFKKRNVIETEMSERCKPMACGDIYRQAKTKLKLFLFTTAAEANLFLYCSTILCCLNKYVGQLSLQPHPSSSHI